MPQPKSIEALADIVEILYTALEKIQAGGTGLKATFSSPKEAQRQFLRLGSARSKLKAQARDLYPPDNPHHGKDGFERVAIFVQDNCIILRSAEIPSTILIEDLFE